MRTENNKTTFEGQAIFVGIDVHLKSWKVTVMAGDFHYKTFSSPPDSNSLCNYLKTNFPGADYYSPQVTTWGYAMSDTPTPTGLN